MAYKVRWLCADFECSNSKINIEKQYTRVWLWDIYDHETRKHVQGTDIETFFLTLFDYGSCTIYFHNLKYDGAFIINYLLKNGFTISDSEENFTISTLITDRLIWYTFTIHVNNKRFQFRDSMKKITGSLEKAAKDFELDIGKGVINYNKHRDKGYVPSQKEKEYIKTDTEIMSNILEYYYANGMTGMTNASDAMKAYKKIVTDTGYKRYFPVLNKEIDDFIRRSYKGGFCYLNPKFKDRFLTKIYTYDVKSMYPSVMRYCMLPYGIPEMYEGEYKFDSEMPLYIQEVRVDCKLKEGRIPSIQTKSFMSLKLKYLEDTNGKMMTLVLTSLDLERLLDDYEIFDIVYVKGLKFAQTNLLFKDYVDFYYRKKEESKGAKKQLYKIFLNSLYGKFAMMTERSQAIPKIENEHNAYDRTEKEEHEAVYTAVASFITANARKKLLDGIYANLENFIYCDTDSMHLIDVAKNITIGKELGNFDLENGKIENGRHISYITLGKYLGQKCYMLAGKKNKEYYELKKIAGAPDAVKRQIGFHNFKINFTSDADHFPKFRMKNVDGGVLLIPTEFTIKEKAV